MQTVQSPIEIWYQEPKLRTFLTENNIVIEKDGSLVIPSFKCKIEKPSDGKNQNVEIRNYPFYHQKLLFMLDAMNGNYVQAVNMFSQGKSFICGKSLEITVTLL